MTMLGDVGNSVVGNSVVVIDFEIWYSQLQLLMAKSQLLSITITQTLRQ